MRLRALALAVSSILGVAHAGAASSARASNASGALASVEPPRHAAERTLAQLDFAGQPIDRRCDRSDAVGYDCVVRLLNDQVTVHYTVPDDDSTSVAFRIQSLGTGWLALSWPEPETRLSMIGGIAVLGRMVNAVGSVGVYDLTSHHFTGVVPANPEKPRAFSISDVTFQQGSAGSMMSFRRPLTHMYTGQASYTLQAAYHPSSNEMEYHGGGVTGFEIALGTLRGHSGAVYKAEDMRAYYLWHGWLMFAGWGVLIPIGTLFARRLKDCGPVWLKVHRACNAVGLLAATASLVLAMALFRVDKPAAHRIIGIAAMMAGWLQAISGIFRAEGPGPGARPTPLRALWLWSHRWLGYVAIVAASVDVFLGIDKYDMLQFNTRSKYHIAFGTWLGVLFVAALGLELRAMLRDAEYRPQKSVGISQPISFSNPVSRRFSTYSATSGLALDSR